MVRADRNESSQTSLPDQPESNKLVNFSNSYAKIAELKPFPADAGTLYVLELAKHLNDRGTWGFEELVRLAHRCHALKTWDIRS